LFVLKSVDFVVSFSESARDKNKFQLSKFGLLWKRKVVSHFLTITMQRIESQSISTKRSPPQFLMPANPPPLILKPQFLPIPGISKNSEVGDDASLQKLSVSLSTFDQENCDLNEKNCTDTSSEEKMLVQVLNLYLVSFYSPLLISLVFRVNPKIQLYTISNEKEITTLKKM
jgi:hypothetical protein